MAKISGLGKYDKGCCNQGTNESLYIMPHLFLYKSAYCIDEYICKFYILQ